MENNLPLILVLCFRPSSLILVFTAEPELACLPLWDEPCMCTVVKQLKLLP